MIQGFGPRLGLLLLPIAVIISLQRSAEAIPAFAQQTGQPCTACHIGGFGPQLTPVGRAFKIGGYTQGGGEGLASNIPLSLMIQTSFNNTGTDQNPPPQHYGPNNNFSLDQVSGFIGGHIGDHVGGFAQFTWSDVNNASHVDNLDLRPYTTILDLGGKELRVGATLNNTPTVQDPYNTTFAWASLILPLCSRRRRRGIHCWRRVLGKARSATPRMPGMTANSIWKVAPTTLSARGFWHASAMVLASAAPPIPPRICEPRMSGSGAPAPRMSAPCS